MLDIAYVGTFAAAALGCLLAIYRASGVAHDGTRQGLYGLLVASGLWAGTYLVTFLTTSKALATYAHQVGLVCGLASVGAWLYFCSAYAGRSYHRERGFRIAAVVVFLSVSAVKLTNQFHGWYFEVEMVSSPFAHASVRLLPVHWLVTGAAYALSGVGFYVLFRLFSESELGTRGLSALVGLTALPVVGNALALLEVPGFVVVNFEPVGVAVFAVGALYLAEDTFEQVRWAGHRQALEEIDEAILLVDESGTIYQCNGAAESLFPGVEPGAALDDVPLGSEAGTEWAEQARLLSVDRDGETQYYLSRETELSVGPHRVGRAVVVTDVTTVERQRRELQRQSDQLEGFGAAIAHELRNALTVVSANATLVSDAIDSGDVDRMDESVDRITDATHRMEDVIGDLARLARLSKPVTRREWRPFEEAVASGFAECAVEGIALTVAGDGRIETEPTRFAELIGNAARLADRTGAAELTVTLTDDGFLLRTDGDPLAAGDETALFEYGTAIPNAESGMLGPNIASLARAHGWTVTADGSDAAGITVAVRGVNVERDA